MNNILETDSVRLRALEPEDIDVLYKWENDTRIWKMSNTVAPFSKYVLRRFIEDQKYDIYETKQLRMIIESRGDGRAVGAIDLFEIDPTNRRAGIGILVYEDRDRGQGYASCALTSMIKYAFQVLVEHVLLRPRITREVLGITAGPRIVLQQHPDARSMFDDILQRLRTRSEVHVAAPRFGIDAPRNAHSHAEYLAALYPAAVYEAVDAPTYLLKRLFIVRQDEIPLLLADDDIVLEVRHHIAYIVAPDVDAGEIDGRIGQPEDIGTAPSGSLYLAVVHYDVLLDELPHELGDGRNADVQLAGEVGQCTLAVERHVGDDILFYQNILMGDTLQGFVLLLIEKILKKHRLVFK